MTRIMRDSVTVSSIPIGGTQIAAGYDDGSFDNMTALALRFPHIPRVLVDVNGSLPRSAVRDWETGDKAGNLEQWVIAHNAATGKKDAVVYCNRATIAEVRQLTGSQVLGKDYWLWVATLDGTIYGPQQLAGVIACQDKGSNLNNGNYDESVVFADWWMAPASPPPNPLHAAALSVSAATTRVLTVERGIPGFTGVYSTQVYDATGFKLVTSNNQDTKVVFSLPSGGKYSVHTEAAGYALAVKDIIVP